MLIRATILISLCLAPFAAFADEDTSPPKPIVTFVEPAEQGISGSIRVHVEGLPKPKERATAIAEYEKWVLYLDRQPMPGIHPISVDLDNGDFYFELKRDDTSAGAWKRAFAGVWKGRSIAVSLGPANGGEAAVSYDKNKFRLVLVSTRRAILGLVGYVALVAVFFIYGRKSDMLRAPAVPNSGIKSPFSLGRVQLAWWSIIILGAYLFIGFATANWTSALSTTAITLLGISAATGGAATGIDLSKQSKAADMEAKAAGLAERTDLLKEAATRAAATDAPALGAQLQAAVAERERVKVDLAQTHAEVPAPSEGIVKDIVSDRSGVVLYRLQAAVWSVVLGIVFISLTIRDLAMPEFDATLLALMGLSSGAYLGFKVPERS